ncbi:hypothetical protein [Flammeovirga sp. OC4]|uniref:hypothetical protein n=1 Tax=Flammeovirga sp. OC4 TaxID=1382345 RepID=UPI0005C6A57F|nr:hypothetical protein [Flammeovirga sp. OC4]
MKKTFLLEISERIMCNLPNMEQMYFYTEDDEESELILEGWSLTKKKEETGDLLKDFIYAFDASNFGIGNFIFYEEIEITNNHFIFGELDHMKLCLLKKDNSIVLLKADEYLLTNYKSEEIEFICAENFEKFLIFLVDYFQYITQLFTNQNFTLEDKKVIKEHSSMILGLNSKEFVEYMYNF